MGERLKMRNLIYFLVFNLAYAHYYDSSSESYDSAIEGFGADYSGSVSESYDEIYDGGIFEGTENEFNFMARIVLKKDKTELCDGSIIGERWIITAAHCCEYEYRRTISPRRVTAKIGLHYDSGCLNTNRRCDNDRENSFELGRNVTVQAVKIHPKYNSRNYINDACLLRTEKMNFDEKVGQITLGHPYDNIHDKSCIALGWGKTEKGHQSAVLLKVPMMNKESDRMHNLCRKRRQYPQFCASSLVPGGGVCHGDSGGPYLCERSGKNILYGLTSYGKGSCGSQNIITAFTDVRRASMRKWINRVTHKAPRITRKHVRAEWSEWDSCKNGCRGHTTRSRKCEFESELMKCKGPRTERQRCSRFCRSNSFSGDFSSSQNTCNPNHSIWKDKYGNACSVYQRKSWCTSNGHTGRGWRDSWGDLTEFSVHGFSGFNCPQCGCE